MNIKILVKVNQEIFNNLNTKILVMKKVFKIVIIDNKFILKLISFFIFKIKLFIMN